MMNITGFTHVNRVKDAAMSGKLDAGISRLGTKLLLEMEAILTDRLITNH
jgi:hypothetical protein